MELRSISIEFLLVLSTLASVFVAVGMTLFLMLRLKDRSKSGYDSEHHEAKLSEMRESYDKRFESLSRELMATEQRWKDVNHLLIAAQNYQSDRPAVAKTPLTGFLRDAGITDRDLVIDPKLILVLTPFSARFEKEYRIVADACAGVGLRCMRGDEEHARTDILSHVLRIMVRSRVVIANISSRNPNVFYELGIAQALDKPTILLARTVESIPFDVKSKRVLIYKEPEELHRMLIESLLRIVSEAEQPV